MIIELRLQHNHPFKPNAPVYRAFEIKDGQEFNLRLAHEDADELKARVSYCYNKPFEFRIVEEN